MRVLDCFSQPIVDRKIDGKCWLVRTTVKEYLEMVSLSDNPFQRSLLSLKNYTKLINDILDDTSFPPISVVSTEHNLVPYTTREIPGKFKIIDGLQRTNCLLYCAEQLAKGAISGRTFNTLEEFHQKELTLEVWEKLDFKSILYKMLVLNTGQKKMDYGHQLDILNESFYEKLNQDGIRVIKRVDQLAGDHNRGTDFLLSDVTEGLVSFINKYPIAGKKNAAEFLFERFNISLDVAQEEESLNTIYDDETYNYMKWVLTDLSQMLDTKYPTNNPLRKYNVFLIALCASLGFSYKKNSENLRQKIDILLQKIDRETDPLGLDVFEKYYGKFTSGIGEKRRKFIFEALRDFFTTSTSIDVIEWDQTYERFF